MVQPRRMTRPTTPGLRVLPPTSSLRHSDSSKASLFQRRLTCAHLASMNLGSHRNTARMSSSDILLNLSGKEDNANSHKANKCSCHFLYSLHLLMRWKFLWSALEWHLRKELTISTYSMCFSALINKELCRTSCGVRNEGVVTLDILVHIV